MAREKFVVRLLGEDDQLLAWATVYGEPRPNGRRLSCCYFPVAPTKFVIERDGEAHRISIHWCDLDIGRVQNILGAPIKVSVGQMFDWTWVEPLFQVVGQADVPFPVVTVRENVGISVPAGSLNAEGR